MTDRRGKLIAHINRKDWWHVPTMDPEACQKRGKFFSSTYGEAEFYGRPLDQPEKVEVSNPLIGDEDTIEAELLGRVSPEAERARLNVPERRFALDGKFKRAALAKGYDAIVLMTPKAFTAYKVHGKIPRSIELNVLKPCTSGRKNKSTIPARMRFETGDKQSGRRSSHG